MSYLWKDTAYFFKQKHQTSPATHYLVDDIFNEEELDYLANVAKSAESYGKVGAATGTHVVKKEIRKTKITWLSSHAINDKWVFYKLEKHIEILNQNHFHYEISNLSDIQLANYVGEEQGKYDWHMDCGAGPIRKMSIAIQLTDPNEYTGGEFKIKTGSLGDTVIPKRKGLAIFFPSFLLHCVTPVLSGERQSLVCWVNGNRPFA